MNDFSKYFVISYIKGYITDFYHHEKDGKGGHFVPLNCWINVFSDCFTDVIFRIITSYKHSTITDFWLGYRYNNKVLRI